MPSRDTEENIHYRVFFLREVGHPNVVCGRLTVLHLAAGEDVDADEVGLGVAVLARPGHADLDQLARVALEVIQPMKLFVVYSGL